MVLDFLGPDRWHASFFVGDKSLRALVREKADAGVVSKIQGYLMQNFAIAMGIIVALIVLPPLIRFAKG